MPSKGKQRSKASKRRVASTTPASSQDGSTAQRDGGSSLQEEQGDTVDDVKEKELEFSLANLRRTARPPTQEDLSWMPADSVQGPWGAIDLAVETAGGTRSVEPTEPMLSASGERFFRARITMNLPGNNSVVAAGDGCIRERAERAASLHALAKMRDMGLLKLSGPVTKEELDDQREGMMDIYNYAARYRYIPIVSMAEYRGWSQISIAMPQHGIQVGIKIKGSSAHAETAAAREFKRQAELYHLGKGAETVLVRDRYALSTKNAPDFFRYCRDHDEPIGPFHVNLSSSGSWWVGKPIFKLDLGMKLKVSARKKEHTLMIANLVGALSVMQKHQHLYEGFTKALRAGHGKYLPKLEPLNVALGPEVQKQLNAIQGLPWPHRSVQDCSPAAQVSRQASRGIRAKRALAPEQLATKSSQLRKKMDEYKTRDDLHRLRTARAELPMTQYSSRVRQIVHDNVYCVIIGATGSGKTTQVPQILLDQAIETGTGASCNVICTQPRRIAATSVAERVAGERAEQLQDTVGYHVRFDAKLPKPGGSILYCTAGILLQQLQHAPDSVFDHASHLVIDEVHERDLTNDFLLMTLKYAMAARAAQGKKLPRVVLMSATIDAEQFADYFRNSLPSAKSTDCPTLNVPGRTFPVREYYLDDVVGVMKDMHGQQNLPLLRDHKDTVEYLKAEEVGIDDTLTSTNTRRSSVIDWKSQAATTTFKDAAHAHDKDDTLVPLGLAATTVAHIAKTSETGAILVFLPGMVEIQAMDKLLRVHSPLGVDFDDAQRFQIIMLHSSIQDSQKTVFNPVPKGCRKIILSTNIAETSVTIPDVQFVVDTGKCREKRYDQTRRITQLQCTWISRSNAKQRAGRAGRVRDGAYYALFTRSRHASMRAVGLPELLRSDLQETCLDVKLQAFNRPVADFLAEAIEPPPPSAVETAIDNLISLGALTEEEELTPLGRVLASLPVHPTLGKMIVLGIIFRCLDPMIILGAAANQRRLFLRPFDKRDAVDKIRRKFAGSSKSDHIVLLKAFHEARGAISRSPREAYYMFGPNFMDRGAFQSIDLAAREIVAILTQAGLIKPTTPGTTLLYGGQEMNQNSGSEALIKALLVAGLYPNFAVQTDRGFFRTPAEKDTRMHMTSVNDGTRSSAKFFAYDSLSLQSNGDTMFLRETSWVTPLMALLFGGPLVQHGQVLEMDEWLPMAIKLKNAGTPALSDHGGRRAPDQILFLRGLMDRMLADAFDDLASQAPLSGDSKLDELASKLTSLLNEESGNPKNLRLDKEVKPAGRKGLGRPANQDRDPRTSRLGNRTAARRPSTPFGSSVPPRARYRS